MDTLEIEVHKLLEQGISSNDIWKAIKKLEENYRKEPVK